MVYERRDGGRLTAIDRSPRMVETAARRNAAFVEEGRQRSWWRSSRTWISATVAAT
jgi:trans-aconitate methyltransferase